MYLRRSSACTLSSSCDFHKKLILYLVIFQAGRTPLDCAKDWNLLQKIFMHVSARWEEAKVAQRKAEAEVAAEREKRELAEARIRELEHNVEQLLNRKVMLHSLSLPHKSIGPVLED